MPYIKQAMRDAIRAGAVPTDAGELNYAITRLIRQYLPLDPRYRDFNEVIGVLESAKLELYRRMVGPYENYKCAENGDVYNGGQ